jgi:hypothetical protein
MSEESLRRLIQRIETDEGFRESLANDTEAALKEFELSGTERYALIANDEDALRRLMGSEVAAFQAGRTGNPLGYSLGGPCAGIEIYDPRLGKGLAPGIPGGMGPGDDASSTKIASCGWTFGDACC